MALFGEARWPLRDDRRGDGVHGPGAGRGVPGARRGTAAHRILRITPPTGAASVRRRRRSSSRMLAGLVLGGAGAEAGLPSRFYVVTTVSPVRPAFCQLVSRSTRRTVPARRRHGRLPLRGDVSPRDYVHRRVVSQRHLRDHHRQQAFRRASTPRGAAPLRLARRRAGPISGVAVILPILTPALLLHPAARHRLPQAPPTSPWRTIRTALSLRRHGAGALLLGSGLASSAWAPRGPSAC